MLQKFEKWHQTKQGLIIFTGLEAGLAYLFASLAIDSGSLIEWVLAIVFAIGAVQNAVKFTVVSLKKGHDK